MAEWDRDRYEELQDSAWERELLANEQERSEPRADRRSSATNRAEAAVLRQDAAFLLARYWEAAARSRQTPRTGAVDQWPSATMRHS